MKRLSLIFASLCLIFSCSKDKDSSDNPSPNPTGGSCKISSFQEQSASGLVTRPVRYDSKNRIVRWGVDSMVYNDFTNEFTVVTGDSRWLGGTPKGKINDKNQITELTWPDNKATISYDQDGRISAFTLAIGKGQGGAIILDGNGYPVYKSNSFTAIESYTILYQGSEIKEINRSITDSVVVGPIPGANRDAYEWKTITNKTTYEYQNQTVFSVNPLINFYGFIFGNRSNLKIPTKRTMATANDTIQPEYKLEFSAGQVLQVDGNTPKIINSTLNGFEQNLQFGSTGCN